MQTRKQKLLIAMTVAVVFVGGTLTVYAGSSNLVKFKVDEETSGADILSTGDVVYVQENGEKTTLFARDDILHLASQHNVVVDEIAALNTRVDELTASTAESFRKMSSSVYTKLGVLQNNIAFIDKEIAKVSDDVNLMDLQSNLSELDSAIEGLQNVPEPDPNDAEAVAAANADIDYYLKKVEEAVANTNDALNDSQSEIIGILDDAADDLQKQLDTTNAALETEVEQRKDAVTDAMGQIAGGFDSKKTYKVGDLITYKDVLYSCTINYDGTATDVNAVITDYFVKATVSELTKNSSQYTTNAVTDAQGKTKVTVKKQYN